MPFYTRYISDHGAASLKSYKYAGEDRSVTFKHILNPIYNKILPWIPYFLAPNLITLTGFCMPLATHIALYYYTPALMGEAPNYIYVLCSLAMVGYMTLDALDGKQARRTGASSPLGLLVDHGCDAMNTAMSCITMCAVLQISGWKALLLLAATTLTFFAATWEEYYTGELILPAINGANEGVLITASIYMIAGIMGPSFYQQTNVFGILNSSFVIIISVFASICTIAANVYNVFNFFNHKKRTKMAPKSLTSEPTFLVALSRWIPILFIVTSFIGGSLIFPNRIIKTNPRLVMWTQSLMFCKMVTSLMLAHLCDEEYHPYGKTVVIFLFRAYHVAVYHALKVYSSFTSSQATLSYLFLTSLKESVYDQFVLDEQSLVWELFGIAVVSYAHLILCATYEITSILNISVFFIDTGKAYSLVYGDSAAATIAAVAAKSAKITPLAITSAAPPLTELEEEEEEAEAILSSAAARSPSRRHKTVTPKSSTKVGRNGSTDASTITKKTNRSSSRTRSSRKD